MANVLIAKPLGTDSVTMFQGVIAFLTASGYAVVENTSNRYLLRYAAGGRMGWSGTNNVHDLEVAQAGALVSFNYKLPNDLFLSQAEKDFLDARATQAVESAKVNAAANVPPVIQTRRAPMSPGVWMAIFIVAMILVRIVVTAASK